MLEQWLEELGATLIQSIHGDGVYGYAFFGPSRAFEYGRSPAAPEEGPALILRYSWDEIHVGWNPTFDRWANSVDWRADVPNEGSDLARILAEAVRRGDAGDRREQHDFVGQKIVLRETTEPTDSES